MGNYFFVTDYLIYSQSLAKDKNRLVYKTFSFKASLVGGIKYSFFGCGFFRCVSFILVFVIL